MISSMSMTFHLTVLSNPTSDIQYLDALFALAERAQRAQRASPHLYPNGRDFYEHNLQGVLAFDGERLIGYAALRKMEPWPGYLDAPQHPPEQCALMLLNLFPSEKITSPGSYQSVSQPVLSRPFEGFGLVFRDCHNNVTFFPKDARILI